MALGSNLTRKHYVLKRILAGLWARKRESLRKGGKFYTKAGAPANNTSADNAYALYDLCYDTTNLNIYLCTAYSSDASATTWTKIN